MRCHDYISWGAGSPMIPGRAALPNSTHSSFKIDSFKIDLLQDRSEITKIQKCPKVGLQTTYKKCLTTGLQSENTKIQKCLKIGLQTNRPAVGCPAPRPHKTPSPKIP